MFVSNGTSYMKLDLSLVKFSLLDTKFFNAGILERTKAIKSSSNLTTFFIYLHVFCTTILCIAIQTMRAFLETPPNLFGPTFPRILKTKMFPRMKFCEKFAFSYPYLKIIVKDQSFYRKRMEMDFRDFRETGLMCRSSHANKAPNR